MKLMHEKIDLLIAGGGIAGLSAALKARQINREISIVVIDKSEYPGGANLSGAVFETDCLSEIIPDWNTSSDPYLEKVRNSRIEKESMYFLNSKRQIAIPSFLLPKNLKHKNDSLISVSELCSYLAERCRLQEIGIYYGFSIDNLIIQNNAVKGVRLKESGLSSKGEKMKNHLPGEDVFAGITIIADGSLGCLSRELVSCFSLRKNINPQVYSIGVKQVFRLEKGKECKEKKIINTLGYPCRIKQFGGGFVYFRGDDTVSVGLITALDWPYNDIQPQKEIALYTSHPFIKKLTGSSRAVSSGAKTIPEGGYYSLPVPGAHGALLAGDAGGFVNISKFKGLHLAVKSGAAAGDAAAVILGNKEQNNFDLEIYKNRLEKSGVYSELKKAANFRQVFNYSPGIISGAPLSIIQHLIPFPLKIKPDNKGQKKKSCGKFYPEYPNRELFVSLAGVRHREDQPPHIELIDKSSCEKCRELYSSPCLYFCPGKVYQLEENGKIGLSPSNCLHDYTCTVKCPFNNIRWTVPEGGDGPRYFEM